MDSDTKVFASDKLTDESIKVLHNEFSHIASPFYLQAKNIRFLNTASEFYQQILDMIRKAKHRLVLASLYFSCTHLLEEKLMQAIETQMCQQKSLRLVIVLDKNRMKRSGKCFIKFIEMLKKKYQTRVRFSLFEIPSTFGILQDFIDTRIREFAGVFHIKIYIADDTCLWSGANLSRQYFQNRADRYMVVSNSSIFCDFCFRVAQRLELHAFLTSSLRQKGFKSVIRKILQMILAFFVRSEQADIFRLRDLLIDLSTEVPVKPREKYDTVVYPFLQFGPANVNSDSHVVSSILKVARDFNNCQISFASAYCNFTHASLQSLVYPGKSYIRVLTSALACNSFNGGAGFTQLVPHFYHYLTRHFYKTIHKADAHHRMSMWAWYKEGCTFHAKGLWMQVSDSNNAPQKERVSDRCIAMVIGSSNLGSRSEFCDLEMSIALVTTNIELQHRMSSECDELFKHASKLHETDWVYPLTLGNVAAYILQLVVSFIAWQIRLFL